MLVVSFNIEVGGRPAVFAQELRPLSRAEDRHVRDPRVEPDVEDVRLLLELGDPAPVRSGREEILRRPRIPRVAAFAIKDHGDVVEELRLLLRRVGPRIDSGAFAVLYGVEDRYG